MKFSRAFLIVILAILLSAECSMAQTNRPDQNTGAPEGMNWEATIVKVKKQPAILTLQLIKVIGGCTFAPTITGIKGDTIEVQADGSKIDQYQVGQTIHVWMVGHSGNLTHPPC
jgi:hypothetical protein